MSEQEDKTRLPLEGFRLMTRDMRRRFAKATGTKLIHGINEGHVNPGKNKKGLLDIAKKNN